MLSTKKAMMSIEQLILTILAITVGGVVLVMTARVVGIGF